MFQMDIKTPQIYKSDKQRNHSDCRKYNENIKVLRNLFLKYYSSQNTICIFVIDI